MEEKYRWIKVRILSNGEEISVRQGEEMRDLFFDAGGRAYSFFDLDFTHIPEEENALMNSYMKSQEDLRRMNEEHERTQNQLREMLASMDAKAIADHQSVIDEAAYWRKLRGDIALEIIRQRADKENYGQKDNYTWICRITDTVFNELYNQHQEFLTKK